MTDGSHCFVSVRGRIHKGIATRARTVPDYRVTPSSQSLGCILYKLAFFDTPFDLAGPLAVLNLKYDIPPHSYSDRIESTLSTCRIRHWTPYSPRSRRLLRGGLPPLLTQ